ncbi:FAD-dependent oxidoreductase [Methylobacterium aquaticum]|uniref:FAD-dependent oxidoreductase n=1 Tax=Methylobacterium aquaticum TaxID=270351 RepID=UPI003D1650DA
MAGSDPLPVAVIGGGPIGLAAAAHLVQRGLPVKVYEMGVTAGSNVRAWQHVRLFSPWKYNVDATVRALLLEHGWQPPEGETYPSGEEFVAEYLEPLAAVPALAAAIEYGARVTAVSRLGIDKIVSSGREKRPFVLTVTAADGRRQRRDLVRAVVDASGTWSTPNPLGAGGVQAEGEEEFADLIAYGLPDVLGRARSTYIGKTTLVVGAGHSAANVLLDLVSLSDADPATTAIWATRGTNLSRVYGGGANDELAARGELGTRLQNFVESGRIQLATEFSITAVRASGGQLVVEDATRGDVRRLGPVDRIVAATGQRPNLDMTREVRLDLDPCLESTKALGPLIDPNLHSCGSVPPHGHRELAHPEPGIYTVGIKSYGRAPTFLMLTGFEQARSVAAAIAGDLAAADDVHLVLPETGVCSTRSPDTSASTANTSCCGSSPATPVPEVIRTSCCGTRG